MRSQTAGWPRQTWVCGRKRYVRVWNRAGNGRERVPAMHDAQQEQAGAGGGHNGVAGHGERAGMRRPRAKDAGVGTL
jgi:hypothetical protein